MLGTTRKQVLKVSLLDISPHNKSILEFFFARAGSRLFKTSSESDADIFIVDFDHPNAEKNWEKTNENFNKPTLALAFYETKAKNTIWLAKPLTIQTLTDAASKARSILKQKPTSPVAQEVKTPPPPKSSSNRSLLDALNRKPPVKKAPSTAFSQIPERSKLVAAPSNTATKAKPIEAEKAITPKKVQSPPTDTTPRISLEDKKKRWHKLCGDAEDIKNTNNWKNEALLYTPENYLISSIQDTLRLATQSRQTVKMQYQNVIFHFMPKQNQAYSNIAIDSESFETLCKTPIKKNDVVIHIMSSKEVELAQNIISASPKSVYDLEGLIWTAMLLTSSGKLHKNIDLKRRIMLKHWPNFTKIETFPHVIRISALWSDDAFNMLEIAHNLKIPQRYVFSFYNAACILGLMEHDLGKLKAKTQQEKPQNKNRGLFSRLLKRLTG